MTKTITTAAITFAASLLPLSAANAAEPRSADISYADLDLSSEAGQAIFDRRIEAAVEAVCGRTEGRPTFDRAVRECQAETRIAAKTSRDLAVAKYGQQQLARKDRKIRLVAR
ncbi:UrcA family protein [Erythrobacter sp.]|uniref:UrcA family protein n=1 Tax=Erythrobacter sp. TaxID=1042 RepID=UPI001425D179|nr:UrcA family protein [Erythrobacter sp.]QIQ86034.1 MAG: UrcA family protein [Erythrobacter sp.]